MTWFRDRVVVTRGESTGHQNPDGSWTSGPGDQVILDCPANVQAGGLIAANRRSVSTTYADADGVAYVPKVFLAKLLDVIPDDRVHIAYAPIRGVDAPSVQARGAEATVRFVRPEDKAMLLRYV